MEAKIKAGSAVRALSDGKGPRTIVVEAQRLRLATRAVLVYVFVANVVLAIKIAAFNNADFQAVDRLGHSFALDVERR